MPTTASRSTSESTQRLQIIDPDDRLSYPGRYCDHCNTIALELTQQNVAEILFHEMAHASLHAHGDPQWGQQGESFASEMQRYKLVAIRSTSF
jgi:hypothetical protein